MSYTDYDLNTLNVALDLASLGDGTLAPVDLLDRQRDMYVQHGYAHDEALLTRLGARLAAVLGEHGEEEFYDALAALLAETDCKPYLTRHDGTPHLHYAPDGAPFAQWLRTMVVAGLVVYVCRNGRSRLRRCAASGCGRWFADASRNGSRRYCEHACASRTTVAAFRQRQKRNRDATAGTMLG